MNHENKKSFYKPYICVVFAALAFSLASCSSEDSMESGQASEAEKRTAPVGQVDVAMAGDDSGRATSVAETSVGKSTYDSVCFACHAAGIAGAPKQGDKEAWAARLDQGNAALYDNAINGFTGSGGMMPAKGGRADLSENDVKAAVDYMLEAIGAGSTAAAATTTEETPATTQETTDAPVAATGGKGKEVYDSTCFICHTTGVAGAPKLDDKETWASRTAQGIDTLYDHAINGFMGQGMMPPKGGKADLSDDDVKAAVDYMVESGS